ncbi:NlpC/P60 family protein [Brevibacillus sp. H7]|uniref:C40 family peptidase n=1 Tax=Brevibacillus sp. H7 TaxID=3349138 RepID=UPI0037FFD996
MTKRSNKLFTIFFLFSLLPTTAHAAPALYVVSKGDTLSKIARQHQTTVEQLMQVNQLTSDRLAIGQTLALSAQTQGHQAQEQPVPVDVTAVNDSPSTISAVASATNAMVTADVLNVRQSPSLDGQILAKLPYGTVLEVVEPGDEWTKVLYQQSEAYVATRFLTMNASVSAAPPITADHQWMARLQEIVQPLLHTRYILGGTTPDGFDCSGFTSYVYQQLGLTLPRTSEEQFEVGQAVALEQAVPGDLLFYDSLRKGRVSHVAMYLGNGMIVHANGSEVRYEKVENMHKLYPFYGVKRYISLDSPQ